MAKFKYRRYCLRSKTFTDHEIERHHAGDFLAILIAWNNDALRHYFYGPTEWPGSFLDPADVPSPNG